MKKILILGLSDKYWVDFAKEFSLKLLKNNFEPIIVFDSRVGEYQVFGDRIDYAGCKTYYLSDFVNEYKGDSFINCDKNQTYFPVYNDYLRLRRLGLLNFMPNKDFVLSYNLTTLFFEKIFTDNDISLVFHETVSSSFSYIASNMANDRGIPFMGFVSSKVPNRFEIKSSVNSDSDKIFEIYESLLQEISSVEADELDWANEYINNLDAQVQGFMKSGILNNLSWKMFLNSKNFKMLFGTLKYILKEKEDKKAILFRAHPLSHAFVSFQRNFLRRIRILFLKKYFDILNQKWLDENEYYVYPIHYQPEATTTIGAPFFDDQLDLLTKISFSLPKNKYLLVKEHKSNVGNFEISFYKKLKGLPNVKLIAENENIKNLIRHSKGLITLTGTAGFEAVLLDKPVFVFGDVSYDKHPLCKKFTTWKEFQSDLLLWTEKCMQVKYDNSAFLIAYKHYTVKGDVLYGKKEFNIGNEILNEIIKKIVD